MHIYSEINIPNEILILLLLYNAALLISVEIYKCIMNNIYLLLLTLTVLYLLCPIVKVLTLNFIKVL